MSIFKESQGYRPFEYPWAVEAALKHSIDMYWDTHQLDLQDDIVQYNTKDGLKTNNVSHEVNKFIIDMNLKLFTEMDKTVGEGYTKLLPYVKNNEIRNLLMTFAAREVVHQRAYATLSESIGVPDSEWTEFKEYIEMQDKINAMSNDFGDLSNKLSFAKHLAQILLGEGIGLFGSFTVLLNLKRQGLMMGFNDVNAWSLADETEHVKNNIKILKEIMLELSEAELLNLEECIRDMIDSYKLAEYKFIELMFKLGDAEDLSMIQLKNYIDYLCSLRLYQLGYSALREVKENPLEWMEWMLSGKKHDNFFEKKVTEYSHGKFKGNIDYSKYEEKNEIN